MHLRSPTSLREAGATVKAKVRHVWYQFGTFKCLDSPTGLKVLDFEPRSYQVDCLEDNSPLDHLTYTKPGTYNLYNATSSDLDLPESRIDPFERYELDGTELFEMADTGCGLLPGCTAEESREILDSNKALTRMLERYASPEQWTRPELPRKSQAELDKLPRITDETPFPLFDLFCDSYSNYDATSQLPRESKKRTQKAAAEKLSDEQTRITHDSMRQSGREQLVIRDTPDKFSHKAELKRQTLAARSRSESPALTSSSSYTGSDSDQLFSNGNDGHSSATSPTAELSDHPRENSRSSPPSQIRFARRMSHVPSYYDKLNLGKPSSLTAGKHNNRLRTSSPSISKAAVDEEISPAVREHEEYLKPFTPPTPNKSVFLFTENPKSKVGKTEKANVSIKHAAHDTTPNFGAQPSEFSAKPKQASIPESKTGSHVTVSAESSASTLVATNIKSEKNRQNARKHTEKAENISMTGSVPLSNNTPAPAKDVAHNLRLTRRHLPRAPARKSQPEPLIIPVMELGKMHAKVAQSTVCSEVSDVDHEPPLPAVLVRFIEHEWRSGRTIEEIVEAARKLEWEFIDSETGHSMDLCYVIMKSLMRVGLWKGK